MSLAFAISLKRLWSEGIRYHLLAHFTSFAHQNHKGAWDLPDFPITLFPEIRGTCMRDTKQQVSMKHLVGIQWWEGRVRVKTVLSPDYHRLHRRSWSSVYHDDVIKWNHFQRYWPYVWGIHQSPVNSPHKGQWRGALIYSLRCALNKQLSKQSWGWWSETPSRSLWRHSISDTLSGSLEVCGWRYKTCVVVLA